MPPEPPIKVATLEVAPKASDEVIACDICSFTFTDKNILEMHQKLLHQTSPDEKTGKYSYHCHLCSKRFRMRGSLMVHLRVSSKTFIFFGVPIRPCLCSFSSGILPGRSNPRSINGILETKRIKWLRNLKNSEYFRRNPKKH